MKFLKKILATALVAAVVFVGPASHCYAWTSGSSSGKFEHYGTQDQAYVKIWVTNGVPTELYAYVYTTQRYKGSAGSYIYRYSSDYSEYTYSASAVKNAESGYRIYSYSGYANVKKEQKKEKVDTTYV